MLKVRIGMAQKLKKLAIACVIVVLAFLIAAIVIPNVVRSRVTYASNACPNNLRQIDGAKQQWQLEYKKTGEDNPSLEDLQPYMGRGSAGTIPQCPHGGKYVVGRIGQPPTCTVCGSLDQQ